MPWKEKTVKSERETFVKEAQQREISFSALCRKHEITRKTGYKWLRRFQAGEELTDRGRAPTHQRTQTSAATQELILSARDEHPAWGPRKLERYLQNKGYTELPCKSTIGNILKRNERIEPEISQKHKPINRFARECPNDLWQMDYKGDFTMLNGQRCYPLTILDDHSRFSLCLKAEDSLSYERFYPALIQVFEMYGLPHELLCDNGKPWGDSKGCITMFDVWMMRLNIRPIHGRPMHPQTQGKEERFHRTLKEELLRHRTMLNLCDAQQAFDDWQYEYNYERPHSALGLDVPAKHYKVSSRPFLQKPPEPDYPDGARLRRVNYKGYVSICRHRYYLSEAFAGTYLQLTDSGENSVDLHYGSFRVASINLRERLITSKHIYWAT